VARVKTVLVFRHGKSDWDEDRGVDHERPLAPRGVEAAKAIGRFLARVDQLPDRVFTSPAVRARDTVKLAAEAGDWSCPVEVRDRLYDASPADVLEVLRASPDDAERILLAGHEPTCSAFVGGLTGGATVKFPTATVARIDLDVGSWADAAFGRGVLIWLVPPRLLGALD
jgi:phosphohistidine phosphatase